MVNIEIPGLGELKLEYLVLDYNGTIAFDGELISGVEEKLNRLADLLNIQIITADTFGTVREKCNDIRGEIRVLSEPLGAGEKEAFVESLGAPGVVAVGNGANDSLMLKKAGLGIIVIGEEGAAVGALKNADIVVRDIHAALGLLLNTIRVKATLRR